MKKSANKTVRSKGQTRKEWPLIIYMGMIGLGLVRFLASEFTLSTQPHPYHWLLALMGALLGIGVGWLLSVRHGDLKL